MYRSIITASAILAISFLLLGGCGQTGPLYSPDLSDAPQEQTQVSAEAESDS
jgi:predicted small lipoprotein YifL